MSDDSKPGAPPEPPPDPIEDVRKGLGLLFRAAKSAFDSLPTGKVEDVVLSGAREVGRALENVTQTIDKQLFKRDRPSDAPQEEEPVAKKSEAPSTPEEHGSEERRGPRVE